MNKRQTRSSFFVTKEIEEMISQQVTDYLLWSILLCRRCDHDRVYMLLCLYIYVTSSYMDAILRVFPPLKFGPHRLESTERPLHHDPAGPRLLAFWSSSVGDQASPNHEQEEGAKRRREDGCQHSK